VNTRERPIDDNHRFTTAYGFRDIRMPVALPREIAPRIFWLGHCLVKQLAGREVHGGQWCFLIIGTTSSILFDTGVPQGWGEISRQLDALLGGRPLDFVAPSHSELPHSGNLGNLMTKYPRAIAIGDMRDYHLHYPAFVDRFQEQPVGHVTDLGGGYKFHSVDAVIKDLPNTTWGYEGSQKVLFVSDGFAYLHDPSLDEDGDGLHLPGECGRVSTELDDFPGVEDVLHYTPRAIYWTLYRDDVDEMFARFYALLKKYPTAIVAPSHGNVISDPDRVIPVVMEAHRRAFQDPARAVTVGGDT
jgi:glyoxylase-like metal-dependent hydrolase (beta-lactamase superfamily II)